MGVCPLHVASNDGDMLEQRTPAGDIRRIGAAAWTGMDKPDGLVTQPKLEIAAGRGDTAPGSSTSKRSAVEFSQAVRIGADQFNPCKIFGRQRSLARRLVSRTIGMAGRRRMGDEMGCRMLRRSRT